MDGRVDWCVVRRGLYRVLYGTTTRTVVGWLGCVFIVNYCTRATSYHRELFVSNNVYRGVGGAVGGRSTEPGLGEAITMKQTNDV